LSDFVNYRWRNGTQGSFFLNKAGSNAVTTHSDTKRNIPRGLSFAITFFHSTHSINKQLNIVDCGHQVHGTERKISHLLYMDDLKLLGRNENDLKNEIKIVNTISRDLNMNFGLEKCARICLKRGRIQSKMHIGNTFQNIKQLDPRKAYKYLGIEESFDIQHKNEKEKLKEEYLRRLRLVLGTKLTLSCRTTYIYICCTTPLTSRCCILYIYSTYTCTEYF
jgi:hypothetical protein